MSGPGIAAAVFVADVATLTLALFLGIWLPILTALVLTAALALGEVRRGWKRWRVTRTWARRLSA